MDDFFQNLKKLFTTEEILIQDINENFEEVFYDFDFIPRSTIESETLEKEIKNHLTNHDEIVIKLSYGGDTEAFLDSISLNSSTFLKKLSDFKEDELEIKVQFIISKKIVDNKLSVYYINSFFKFLNSLQTENQLKIFDQYLGGRQLLVFEVKEPGIFFYSESIVFKSNQSETPKNINRPTDWIELARQNTHSNIISTNSLLPTDFELKKLSKVENYNKFFNKISLLLSIAYLFDITTLNKDNLEYKINGYKTISGITSISKLDINQTSLFFKIFGWVYNGGNLTDKIGLARNLISLNIINDELSVKDSIFNTIQSGFKIYQQKNIERYIAVRSKVSGELMEFNKQTEKITEDFVSNFKKNILGFSSFFISVLILRVVSKGELAGTFTVEIGAFSIGLLIISVILLFVGDWEFKEDVKRYSDKYSSLKSRYLDLLDEADLDRILNNDSEYNQNIIYLKKKEDTYFCIWLIMVLIFFTITLFLFFYTN